MTAGDLKADAERLVLATTAEGVETLFGVDLKLLSRADTPVLSSTVPVLIMGTLGPSASLTIDAREPATITLALAEQPAKLLVDGAEQPIAYADGALTVVLTVGKHEVKVQP